MNLRILRPISFTCVLYFSSTLSQSGIAMPPCVLLSAETIAGERAESICLSRVMRQDNSVRNTIICRKGKYGMKENIRMLRGLALAATVGLACLSAGSAHAQRGGGRAQSARSTSTAQTGSNSGMAGGCSNGSSGSSGTSSSTGTTTSSGATVQSSTVATESAGAVTASRVAANSATVQWSGSTASVQRVYLAVLD